MLNKVWRALNVFNSSIVLLVVCYIVTLSINSNAIAGNTTIQTEHNALPTHIG